MILIRWSAPSRTIPSREVDGLFGEETEQILLFAFETNRMSVESHSGHLSLKLLAGGVERYYLGNRTITLDPTRILLLNAGQRYASSIDARHTRSVSFFLPPAHVSDAVASLTRSSKALLDSPDESVTTPELPQAPFRPDPTLRRMASRLTAGALRSGTMTLPELAELVMRVAESAIAASLRLTSGARFATIARRSTRDELLSRVLRARDLIEDRRGHVSLNEMASVACLSRFHFLRVFGSMMGCTPAAYARTVRLDHALAELRRGATTRRAARLASYSSGSAFLRALRRRQPGH